MNTTVIHEVLTESQAGKLIFPEVVRRLSDVGVESYLCDLATGSETFYMADGGTHSEQMTLPSLPSRQISHRPKSSRQFAEPRLTRSVTRSS